MKLKVFTFLLAIYCQTLMSQTTQDPLLYSSYPSEPSNPELPTAADCLGPRPNIWSLSSVKKAELNACMVEYLTSEIDHDWVEGDPLTEKWHIVTHHISDLAFWHNQREVGFFTEHRDYIQGMEQYLLNKPGCDQFVPLPSFNPAKNTADPTKSGIPSEFFNGPAVLEGFPPLIDRTPDVNLININATTCSQFANINTFASTIEGQHNTVHNNIGGSMGSLANAPGSTIFWLWHAYLDDKYNCFQELCQGCKPAFVRVKKGINPIGSCDYCIDLTKSTDVTNFTFRLFDETNNTDKIITLNRSGCVSYKDMVSGHKYRIKVEGTNTSTGSNLCGHDEVFYDYTAPVIPPRTKFGDPCQWAKVEPSPNPVIKGDNMIIRVTSNAFSGRMDVKLVNTMSGSLTNIVTNQAFVANDVVELNFNTSNLQAGTYKVWAESEGDLVEATVIVLNP